jgi:hypothetical protein
LKSIDEDFKDFIFLYCQETKGTKESMEPRYTVLNPDLINYHTEYTHIPNDPRLVDTRRGIRIYQDAEPLDGSVALEDVYCRPDLHHFNAGASRPLKNIIEGQTLYYTDKDFRTPFNKYVFDEGTPYGVSWYQDPMGNFTPQYTNLTPVQCDFRNSKGCMNDLEASQYHRQDITSRIKAQMSKADYSSLT